MLLKFNVEKFKSSPQKLGLCVDAVMLLIIAFNLLWLLFDMLFMSHWVRSGLMWLAPQFTQWYQESVHPNFFSYELVLIAVYWTEFLFRWAVSIARQTHHRFWFYPFVRWYDVLGSLPIASFRFLRLLRLVSVMIRLQSTGIVDFSNTPIGRFVSKYKKILTEEISDQVVVNVLENVKTEVHQGQPIVHRVVQDVLLPKRDQLGTWASHRLTDWVDTVYLSRQHEVSEYVRVLVNQAVIQNKELDRLAQVPMIGGTIKFQIETAIADITYTVLDQLLKDLHSDRCTQYLQETTRVILEHAGSHDSELSALLETVLTESLEVIIAEVKVKKWQTAPMHSSDTKNDTKNTT